MYNLLLSVGFELCSSYHKKEKQILELHPFCCFHIVHYFLFQFSSLEVHDICSRVLHIRGLIKK